MKLRGVMRVRSLWRVSLVGAVFLTMVSLGGVAEAVPRGVSGGVGVSGVPIHEVPAQIPGVSSISRMAPHAVASTESTAKRKRLEQKKTTAKKKETALAIQLEGVKANLVELALQLERTKNAIPIAQSELADAEEKLAGTRRELATVQARLKNAQKQKAKLQGDIESGEKAIARTQVTIGQIAQQAYRGQKLDASVWTLLWDARSADELAIRAQAVNRAAQSQNQVIQAAEEAKAVAANARARQEAVTVRIGELEVRARGAVAAADAAKQAEQKQLAELQTLQGRQAVQQQQLNSQKSAFEQEIRVQQAAQAEAARQIAQLVKEARRMQARVITGGVFGAPLSVLNRTSPFGWRTHPILNTRMLHSGTDLAMPCGSPVFASQSGTVRTSQGDGYGNRIIVNHGTINGVAWQTAYAHLSAFKVAGGQHVEKGQVIGLVGSTGWSTGCHLHFETWKNGTPIDSYQVLMGSL